MNGIFFFKFLKGSLLLLYKIAINFCILIMHPTLLLNLFICSNMYHIVCIVCLCVCGVVESLGFSAFQIMLLANRDNYFFLTLMSFSCFSCLITLAGTFSIMLNRNRKSGILALFLILLIKELSAFYHF